MNKLENQKFIKEKCYNLLSLSNNDKIKEYKLCGLYDYYNTEVIGSTVDKFLSGEFDKNKFLKELKSRTEIYLDE